MTETEFRELLARIGSCFLTHQVGRSNGSWVAVGTLILGATIRDLERILDREPIDYEIWTQNGELYIRMEAREEKVLLRIPKIPRVNLVLFLLTVLTTLLAGTMMEGGNPFTRLADITLGIPFAFTLLLILGCHEFGHYYYAQKHHVDATLPYFLPAPPFLFLIGTFGAFIKIKSPIYRRDALLQIGAAGPIAGFIIAVPALLIGLSLSTVVETVESTGGIILGDSLLMKLFTALLYPGLTETQDIMLHPIAFAGWIGLLVTMLNLLPIGQLDGGHIAYAMLGEKHRYIAKIAFLALIPLSFLSLNWLVWGALILLLMRTTRHPPIQDIYTPLSAANKRIGYLCLVIFILCFIPVPFQA